MDSFSLEPVFGWFAVIPLAIILLASLWLTWTSDGISARGRFTLMLLRLAAMAVLLAGWLRPGFVGETTRESAGAVAVLMDRSESMTLPSESQNQSRWQTQQSIWQSIQSATNLAIGQTKVVPYFYDQKIVAADERDMPSLDSTFAQAPNGRATDLGKALDELSRMQVDPPLRGVILVGDATQTIIPASIDPTTIARQMAQLDQPILMVGVGAKTASGQLRDVAIDGLPEQYSAFVKKELSVRLVVSANGVQNQPIKISLKLRASGKPDQIVASREILSSRSSEQLQQNFTVVVPEAGEYLLEATALVDGEDQIESNNTAISFVTVRDGGAKLVYLEGQPRREQLFLKRALNESPEFALDYRLIPQRGRQDNKWPVDLTKRFNFAEYDSIILGDLDASALSPSTMRAIESRVRAGGGLLILGGYHSFDAGGYAGTPLDRAFPIELARRRQRFDAPIDRSLHIEGDVQLMPTRPHPITTLRNEPENARLWRSLKPMMGMNRLGPLRAGLSTQTLLQSQDGDPALIAGQYGSGRVLAFAPDSTWQWWLSGEEKIMQQFWRQCLLWMIRRDVVSEGFRLDLDRRRLLIDETPDLQIKWFGGTENKSLPTDLRIDLSRDGKFLTRVPTVGSSGSELSATLSGLSQPGLYRAALTATADDGTKYESDIAFLVRDESRELSRPEPDWQMMTSIVAANQSAGGRQLLPEEIGQALDWLRERQEATKVTSIEKRRLGDAAWDSWVYLVLFCGLMCCEWWLRKSWQLP